MGEAFTLNELKIMEIMAKGEEVKAKNENRWMRALAREGGYRRPCGKMDVEKR